MKDFDFEFIQNIALKAARAAGAAITDIRAKSKFEINSKLNSEPVTSADVAADKIIVETIRQSFPTHRFLTEELAPNFKEIVDFDSPLWIVDPIDGTVNFMYGQPAVGISIAYLINRETKIGVVHAPFSQETFTAIKGHGAFRNDSPIRASSCCELDKALVATGFPYERSGVDTLTARVGAILKNCRDLRRVGACAIDLCWVACGRLDAYYETVKPWDMAAGTLIAREAGAVSDFITPKASNLPADIDGHDRLTSAPRVYADLMRLLRAV